MSKKPPATQAARMTTERDRRRGPAEPGAAGALRQLKSVLARPIGLTRQDGQLRVVLVERRRSAAEPPAAGLASLCTDLQQCLTNAGDGPPAELAAVHAALARQGWPAVDALPAATLAASLTQARRLARQQPAAWLDHLVDRLHRHQVAADLRDERLHQRLGPAALQHLEVSEASHEEFDALSRGWQATRPPDHDPDDPKP